MNRKEKFESFLDLLKSPQSVTLIESIKQGYRSIFEDHDYDASWDYEIDEHPEKSNLLPIVKSVVEEINKKILPHVPEINGIKIQYIIEEDKEIVARYINGTGNNPVFVLDLQNISQSAKEYGVNVGTDLSTTLVHELAHAIQDIYGLDFNEDQAEEFAHDYHDFGDVNKFWEE